MTERDVEERLEMVAPFTDEMLARTQSVRRLFVIPFQDNDRLRILESIASACSGEYARIGLTLSKGITGTIETLSIPYTQASSAVHDAIFSRFLSSESILALIPAKPTDTQEQKDERAALARKAAVDKMVLYQNSEEGRRDIVRGIIATLDNLCRHPGADEPYRQLARHGVVLFWSAFEVFCRDIFVTFLNDHPSEITKLSGDAVLRKRFDNFKVGIESLSEFGFDFSHSLGTYLSQYNDLSDLFTIKAIFNALFASSDLNEALSASGLRLLALKRNLLVHRGGVIDREFAVKASWDQPEGAILAVSPSDLERHACSIAEASTALLSELRKLT